MRYTREIAGMRAAEAAARPRPGAAEAREAPGPFLTAIVPVWAKGLELLDELLLCLAAQSDEDFEVLLLERGLPPEIKTELEAMLGDLPPQLGARVRGCEASGELAAALNAGFARARGRYAAVLDAGDLLMDHWVESFKKAAEKRPGSILHAYAAAQDWRRSAERGAVAAVGAIEDRDCEPFFMPRALALGEGPGAGFAFPLAARAACGLRFDEAAGEGAALDYLLRLASVTGVAEAGEITVLHRRWQGPNTAAPEAAEERESAARRAQKRMNCLPILLPPGSAGALAECYRDARAYRDLLAERRRRGGDAPPKAALYYDAGGGFSAQKLLRAENAESWPRFKYCYELPGAVRRLRFDPAEKGELALRGFVMTLVSRTGEEFTVPDAELQTSGHRVEDYICFLRDDPQITCSVPPGFAAARALVRGQYAPAPPARIRRRLWEKLEAPPRQGFWRRLRQRVNGQTNRR